MGMLTELLIKAELKIPDKSVKDVIDFLFNKGDTPAELPAHPFFYCERWRSIGRSSSYYHHPEVINSFITNHGYLFSRSDLKNYDNEIEKFIDWIMPYVNEETGKCIGWTWYEDNLSPTMIYKKDLRST